MKHYTEQENLKKGWYHKPHFLVNLLMEGEITKAEYWLLDHLYHLWSWFHYKDDYFFRADVAICATGLISQKSLSKARRRLRDKGYIDYVKGHSHNATKYIILIEPTSYGFDASQYKNRKES